VGTFRREPKWFHEEIRVPLGTPPVPFVFRTLSLADVWGIWPYLLPIKRAMEREKPLDLSDGIEAVLRVINPVLVNDADAMRAFTPAHTNLLINFYERQDWTRIEELMAVGSSADVRERGGSEDDALRADQRFVLICNQTAKGCGMGMHEFVAQRFEFCADQILTARAAVEAAETAERSASWEETIANIQLKVGKGKRLPLADQPAWMRALNEHRYTETGH
jgi:hypothetical protein